MKTYGGVYLEIYVFLTSAFVGGEWSASRPVRFTPGERAPGTHWIRDWVDPRASLDNVEKRNFLTLPGLELQLVGRPARSQSLYRLRYLWSLINIYFMLKIMLNPSCSPLHNFPYFKFILPFLHIVREVVSWIFDWTEHVTKMREQRDTYKIVAGNAARKSTHAEHIHRRQIILKWNWRK
jgi:hypothetical protein